MLLLQNKPWLARYKKLRAMSFLPSVECGKFKLLKLPQQFVETLLLQNKPWLARYKKLRAMSFLPSVECGKFKLKQAFQSGKILACSKKSEICATYALKLIKMMQKC